MAKKKAISNDLLQLHKDALDALTKSTPPQLPDLLDIYKTVLAAIFDPKPGGSFPTPPPEETLKDTGFYPDVNSLISLGFRLHDAFLLWDIDVSESDLDSSNTILDVYQLVLKKLKAAIKDASATSSAGN